MSDLIGWARLATPVHLDLGKEGLRAWLNAHGLEGVWMMSRGGFEVARDYLFNYHIWVFAVIPCLLLETLFPAVMESETRTASRWVDFCYPILGGILIAPFMGVFITGIDEFFRRQVPFLNTGLLDHKPMAVQMLGALIVTDFAAYVSHYAHHKVKWLWYFHSVHHSQENLSPLTANRTHFIETFLTTVIRIAPMAFIGGDAMNWTIFSVLHASWTYFVHSNVKTSLGPIGAVLVTPQFHRVHHSILPEHFDKNFGVRLTIWDRIFGTAVRDTEIYPPTGVEGIEPWVIEAQTGPFAIVKTWARQTAYPFVKIWSALGHRDKPSAELIVPDIPRASGQLTPGVTSSALPSVSVLGTASSTQLAGTSSSAPTKRPA